MKLNITSDWQKIRKHFSTCIGRNMHIVIASVNNDNVPTATPIGSLFLNDNQTGFYFEKFAAKLSKSATGNKNICLLAVNNNKWFWLKSLVKGKFAKYPGVKLYGELGEKREATPQEFRAFQRRVRYTKKLKGYHYMWKEMSMVREIQFTKAEKINLGKMTRTL